MVWSGNGALMWDWGVLDFAGGTVVHINAGIAGWWPVWCWASAGLSEHRDAAA
jgi:ammonia channel protein AmtB